MKKFALRFLFIGCALGEAITAEAQSNYEPYSFTTLAGVAPGSTDGTGSEARFFSPEGVALDSAGNVFVADTRNNLIRKITFGGVVSTLAGSPFFFGGQDDGTGSAARFRGPRGVAVDSAGNIYVADSDNQKIRKITPCGLVSTLAGTGAPGSTDGVGNQAQFNTPSGVAVDGTGNLYVADSQNSTIRKITPAGEVSTFAGLAGSVGSDDGTGSEARFYDPYGVAVDNAGNVYVADRSIHTIRKITPGGVVSTLAGLPQDGFGGSDDGTGSAARFYQPTGVAADSAGNVYVADSGNNTIRKITPAGVVSTLAGLAGSFGSDDGAGAAARFNGPRSLAVDSASNIYGADTGNNTIRTITSAGIVSTLAGSAVISSGSTDGAGADARFDFPHDVAVDAAANVYVADYGNHTIRKITPSGVVSTFAGLAGSDGSADGDGSAARFFSPAGVAVDSAGNVYVVEQGNHTIRKITPSRTVSTLAGSANDPPGSADGTGNAARFNFPKGLAVDSAGNVYVADWSNHTIRKITPSGVVSTLAGLAGSSGSADGDGSAARFFSPAGVAVDSAGDIYVADEANNTIRKITPSGVVSTLAGLAGSIGRADGTGSDARFYNPNGVAVDGTGNVYVADSGSHTIRKIAPSGEVRTLAGLPGSTGGADGTGSAARFTRPTGVAVDSVGNLYVADFLNSTIRVSVDTPPLITTVGQLFTYQLEAIGAISFAVNSLPAGLAFDPQLAAILGVPTVAGTFEVVISAIYPGQTTNSTLTILVQPAPSSGPIITSGTSATGIVGRPFTFQVATTGGSPAARLTASGLPPGLSADPVSGVISGSATARGSSIVTLTVTDGLLTAISTLQLTFTADPALPVIISSDIAFLTPGQFFSYTISVQAVCDNAITLSLIGTLPAGLTFDATTGTISGVYTGLLQRNGPNSPLAPDLAGGALLGSVQLFGTNSHGTSTFQLLFLAAPSGAVNISTRLLVGSGENVLIGGFIITGNAPKVVIIRAIGPSTGIPGALQDPTLELHDSAGHVIVNDNWRESQESQIIATTVPPTDDRESALVIGLDPGNYTAIVSGKEGATGIALAEVYDLGAASLDPSANSKLANISTRGSVQTGNNVMIGGFIVQRTDTRVIVRAIGPSLTALGILGALQDTILELHNGSGSLISSNDDWRSTQEQQIIDTTVPPKDNRESAIVANLTPGNYTAIVRGKDNTTGVALVEVYGLR